mmetsp:Transcript_17529/g.14909  ORF Transcript_17529/g.14909 Transcript_17529/m.14909 type:complete len:80 (-) Transcript_17529:2-241(-)
MLCGPGGIDLVGCYKFFRPRPGDRAKILDELVLGHADSRILYNEQPVLRVDRDADLDRSIGVGKGLDLPGSLEEPELHC